MNTRQLRKAIGNVFPESYSFWTWRKLLPDFVEIHTHGFLERRCKYETQRCIAQVQSTEPLVYPRIYPEHKAATRLLAKEEGHSYEVLAFSYYLLQMELAASVRECEHLRQQVAGLEKVTISSLQLTDKAIATIANNDDPDKRPN